MSRVENIMNWGLGVGAIFSMAIKKFSYAYLLFTVLLAWNILSNFVSGKNVAAFSPVKLLYLFFSILLFFSTMYLTIITFKHSKLFNNDLEGDLPFYMQTSNLIILVVFFIISSSTNLSRALEDMLPNCGDLILLLAVFLFTYILGVMTINISIIVNKKMTDG